MTAIAIATVHVPNETPEEWHFAVIDDTLFPVVWDMDEQCFQPYDLEEPEAFPYEFAEKMFNMPVRDGGVEGADIEPMYPN